MLDFTKNRTITVAGGAIPRLADGSAALELRRISGEEALSTPYLYQLDLVTTLDMPENDAANLDLQAMAGRELTVTIELDGATIGDLMNAGAGKREISGIVTGASFVENLDSRYMYRLTVEPWIVLAKRRSDYRIFQNKTVVDIIDEVLSTQYLYSYEKRLSQVYPPLEYEVQYGESDYDFIQRLKERSGIYWFFEHSGGVHRMILVDGIGAHRPVESEAYRTLLYRPPGHKIDQEYVSYFNTTERIQSGIWTTDDFDFTKPQAELSVLNAYPKETPYNELAIYEWPGNYTEIADGAAYARVRMEDLRARSRHASGRGNLRDVVCGTTFVLNGYPQHSANREYMVMRSKLDAEERGDTTGSGDCTFAADFDVQPVTMPYRPERRAPLPRTTGPQTAIVTGPPGQELWTDEYGRVKLKFHWDRSPIVDQNSSRWIRVSYPWAGSNFGGINIPRIGQEVIVDFENGDPNRPIVTGRVYNAVTMPPWGLPMNATQSGLISRTIGGLIENANALRFEDAAGMEEVWMQAERDLLSQIKNNESHNVGADRDKSIGGNETTDVQGDRTEAVHGNEQIEIDGNRSRTVHQNDMLQIDGDQQTKIDGNQTHDVEKNHDRSVGQDDSLTVKGSRDESIQKDHTLKVEGDQSISVSKGREMQVQQDLKEQINGNQTTQVAQSYVINANQRFELVVGASSLVLDSGGNISLNGTNITISSSGAIAINGNVIDLN